MWAPNNKVTEFMKPKLTDMKREMDKSTIIIRQVNTPSVMNQVDKKKSAWIQKLKQLHLIKIYRTLHQITAQ